MMSMRLFVSPKMIEVSNSNLLTASHEADHHTLDADHGALVSDCHDCQITIHETEEATSSGDSLTSLSGDVSAAYQYGNQLRTYDIAVATTGEYTALQGGTVSLGLAAVATTINRLNLVYETDLCVRLNLIAENDQLIFTDPYNDPYTDFDLSSQLDENQWLLDNAVTNGFISEYDVGHVFSTAGGGLCPVSIGWKTRLQGTRRVWITSRESLVESRIYCGCGTRNWSSVWRASHIQCAQ